MRLVEHQVADADVLRRHHVHAQHAPEMAGLELASHGAIDHVSLGGHAGQDRRDQAGIGLVGNLRAGAEILLDEDLQAGLRQQLKAQTLRADARHFLEPAPGMTRNGDQRHETLRATVGRPPRP